MNDEIERRDIGASGIERVQHTESLIFQRRRRLRQPHRAVHGIEQHEIGKGSADIDPGHLALPRYGFTHVPIPEYC